MSDSRLRTIGMARTKSNFSVGLFREHSFDRLHVLLQVVVEILPQTQEQKERSHSCVQCQQSRKHKRVPQREAHSDVSRPEPHGFPRRTKPTPRTV
jgi:hypothetical protein